MPTPRRTNNRAQQSVGSYTEVLLNRANPQEEESVTTQTNQSLLINPLPPQKRTAITQDVEEKSSDNDAQKGATTAGTVSNTSTHTTSAISTITQIDIDKQTTKTGTKTRTRQSNYEDEK